MPTPLDWIAPAVRALRPYRHGRSIAEIARERGVSDIIKLSSNENPLGPGKRALKVLREFPTKSLSRYPDIGGVALRGALSQKLGVPADCILLGNGSNEVLALTAQLLLCRGRAAVYSQYAFVVYGLATASCRAAARVVAAHNYGHDLKSLAIAANRPGTRLVFIANPNNPTGSWHPPSRLRAFMKALPSDVLVVVDEAYCEYLPDPQKTCLKLLNSFPNLLLTRTFSKIHGLAGLRAGYGIGDAALVEALNRIRQPFNINTIAQSAALAALQDESHVQKSRRLNAAGLARLQDGLRQYGYRWLPSWGNFLTFSPVGGAKTAATVYEFLLNTGVIVRPLGSYGLSEWMRVSVGTKAENSRFLTALGNAQTLSVA